MEVVKADYRALDPLVGLVWPVALVGRDLAVVGSRGCVHGAAFALASVFRIFMLFPNPDPNYDISKITMTIG